MATVAKGRSWLTDGVNRLRAGGSRIAEATLAAIGVTRGHDLADVLRETDRALGLPDHEDG